MRKKKEKNKAENFIILTARIFIVGTLKIANETSLASEVESNIVD